MNQAFRQLPYQEIYSKGQQFLIKTEKLRVQFKGLFYRFEQLSEVLDETEIPVDWILTAEEPDIVITHFYQPNLATDGFHLKISEPKEIKIHTSNLRGLRYGIQALQEVLQNTAGFRLTEIEIKHEPSFAMRGIIEGFYGPPWQMAERLDVISFLGLMKMNTYMYAPKDDALQRKQWRDLYPETKIQEFQTLLAHAEKNQVDFYYMISPGNDIDYTDAADVAVLTTKLQQMIDLGITCFGLLLDDIDYILKGKIKQRFQTAAHAHAYLINLVDTYLASQLADYQLIACPTEYDNRYGSSYLEVLTKETAKHVPFFWTGPSTLAESITTEEIARMSAVYQRPMVIWDNVPVNDYLTDNELIFLSPYENRSPKLGNAPYQVLGIVSNPMAQWALSKIMLATMADYLWDSHCYESIESLRKNLGKLYGKACVKPFEKLISFHPNHYMRTNHPTEIKSLMAAGNLAAIQEMLEELQEAGEQLLQLLPEQTAKQLQPWVERSRQELVLWRLIREGNLQAAQADREKLKETPYRLGVSPVDLYLAQVAKEKNRNEANVDGETIT